MTSDGTTPTLDAATLRAVLADGLYWIVADEDDADRLRAHGFPALCPTDGVLTAEMIKPLTRIIVLQRPGPEDAAFGVRVKERLRQLEWWRKFTRCFLSDPFWDLEIVERETGSERFGPFIASLAAEGHHEILGPSASAEPAPRIRVEGLSDAGSLDDWPQPGPLPQGLPPSCRLRPYSSPTPSAPGLKISRSGCSVRRTFPP
jgi:hypothetical protein